MTNGTPIVATWRTALRRGRHGSRARRGCEARSSVTPSREPFAYAVLRVVPDIEREEFVNAGLVLFCRSRRYLRARTSLDLEQLTGLTKEVDADALRSQLALVERIAAGEIADGPLATMSQSERFH